MANRPAARAFRPTRRRQLAGRYVIGEVIGRGGMSTVHWARDETLDRDVAVKILLPALAEGDPVHVARFEREARAAAALHHPAVVKIYDTGHDRGTHFIVMERVAGQSLDRLLADGHALDPEEATRIAGRVAGALAAAHAAGILHRDIKPANVMVTPAGDVKVLDFGIARARQDPTLTQPALAIGTASYMSPERVLGQPGDERSDIYSLGCLLYAMLAGRPPFVAESTLAILHQQVHDQPRPPGRRGRQIAPPLMALTLGMLAKDPAERPQSASEIAGRLATPAPMPAVTTSAVRAGRRAPLAALAIVAALAALALGLVVGSSGGPSLAARRSTGATSRKATTHRAVQLRPAHPATPTGHPPGPAPGAKPIPPAHGGGPPGHGGVPPGHGGIPPGQAKKLLQGSGGGDSQGGDGGD